MIYRTWDAETMQRNVAAPACTTNLRRFTSDAGGGPQPNRNPTTPPPQPYSPSAPCALPHPPDSPPSVCLCAGGAACYLDDLVREGERDFISCLPEGLWYLWCFKAALLKRKKKSTHTQKRSEQTLHSSVAVGGAQGLGRGGASPGASG